MPKHPDRVRIEEVDWLALFPWLRMLTAFRMAIHPGKLLAALLLVVILFVAGRLLDAALPREVQNGELDQYRQAYFGLQTPQQFEDWRASRDKSRPDALRLILKETPGFQGEIEAIVTGPRPIAEALEQLHAHYLSAYLVRVSHPRAAGGGTAERDAELAGIRAARQRALSAVQSLGTRGTFDASLKAAIDAIDRLVRAAATFNLGWSQTIAARPAAAEPDLTLAEADGPLPPAAGAMGYHDQTTVVAALRDLLLVLPAWLWDHHRVFLIVYLLLALVACSMVGGAIARMAAMHATRDDRITPREAARYVARRWGSFLLAPIVPVAMLAIAALLMALFGLLFNASGIDVLGGLLFFLILLCGFLVAGTLLLTAAGIHMAYPATAIDGSDVFDALARAFNYVLNRPWRWLFHGLVALIHGAVCYLLLSLVLYLTVWAVQKGVGAWVMTQTELGVNRFEAILPSPGLGQLAYDIDYAGLDGSARIAAFFVRCWMFLVIGLLSAFAISYYLSANTWIYLLLRRSADGVEIEDIVVDPPDEPGAAREPAAEAGSPASDPAEAQE
jgi:hypothetical protein